MKVSKNSASKQAVGLGLVFWVGLNTAHAFSSKKTAEATDLSANSSAGTVWVSRPEAGTLCSAEIKTSSEKAAKDLADAHVKVLESGKKSDGKMHIQLCGTPTGTSDLLMIYKSDLAKASALGFKEVDQQK